MKKLFCVLAALLVMASVAFAEDSSSTTVDVTFRNDIKFGMSLQDVVNAETETLVQRTFDNGNPHVTFLASDNIDLGTTTGTVQYLFWDDALFAVLTAMDDGTAYDEDVQEQTEIYGEPQVMSAQGTAEWAERMTGNLPEMEGDQNVWSFSNNISLTMVPFGSGYITLWIDAN